MSNDSSPNADENEVRMRAALIESTQRNTGLSSDDAAAIVDHLRPASARNYALRRTWVASLARLTRAIDLGEAAPFDLFAGAFWVRLHGAMTELPEHFTAWKRLADGGTAKREGALHSLLALERRVHDCCHAMRAALTERELIYVAFARHVESHVTQNGFVYSIEKGDGKKQKPKVRKSTKVPLLGGHRSIDDLLASCASLEAEHGGDVEALTRSIVAKVAKPVIDLYLAMRDFNEAEL